MPGCAGTPSTACGGSAVHERRVAAWSFGEGPVVALMHGWGGYAGQLLGFVAPLVARGFRVVLADAPGHAVFISPMAVQAAYVDVFAAGIGASPEVMRRFQEHAAARGAGEPVLHERAGSPPHPR